MRIYTEQEILRGFTVPALQSGIVNSNGERHEAATSSSCRGAALAQSPPRSSWSLATKDGRSIVIAGKGTAAFDRELHSSLSRYATNHADKPYRPPALRYIGRAHAAVDGVTVPVAGRVE